MLYKEKAVQVEGSMPGAKLTIYIQEPSEELKIRKRPLVLVNPGGGYAFTSDREAEVIALKFLAMGYHAAVLCYSVYPHAVFPTALLEEADSIRYLKEHAEEWNIRADKIFAIGFSAGGHLTASIGCLWNQPFVREKLGVPEEQAELLKPAGIILSYPVITSGKWAHRGSFECLIGYCDPTQKDHMLPDFPKDECRFGKERTEQLLEELSLEKRVTKDVPPVFIWTTFTDEAVPVQNSLLFVNALQEQGIPTEFHMYPEGKHGLSLGNELTDSPDGSMMQPGIGTWISLVETWLKKMSN